MFDVRIFHPGAPSYRAKKLPELYIRHEKEKMKQYNNRVLQTEKASFTPLVYSTNGGIAPQAVSFHKKLARKISEKRMERYSDVMNHMRTKLHFTTLKSVRREEYAEKRT